MKKTLLTCFFAISGLSFAQVFVQEDFNSLNEGNLGTAFDGSVAGQNGWFTLAQSAATNSANSNFQIVTNDGDHRNALQILGSVTASGAKFVHKNATVANAWLTRDAGNDIYQVEFEFYTGSATTSKNTATLAVVDGSSSPSKTLMGFGMALATKVPTLTLYVDPCIFGATYCNNPSYPIGNYSVSFSDVDNNTITLSPDTWVKVGLAFDYNSGEVAIKVIENGVTKLDDTVVGAAIASNVTQTNMIVSAGTSNAVAGTAIFDNLLYQAVPVANLLGVNDNKVQSEKVSIYPNPATTEVNIVAKKVVGVQIFDISGKVVKVIEGSGTKVDVSDLQSGNYIMRIRTSNSTSVTQKFIKQ